MSQELVKALLVEIDGNVEKLRKALRAGEGEVAGFAKKATQANAAAGLSAEQFGSKTAMAARGAASAIETMARTGKMGGEALKQLTAQSSMFIGAFGAGGAVVGSIGIAALAIHGYFERIKREAADAARASAEEFRRLTQMDVVGVSRRASELFSGDAILRADLADPTRRRQALATWRADRGAIGVQGLEQEQQRLLADRRRITSGNLIGLTKEQLNERRSTSAQIAADLGAIDELLPQLRQRHAEVMRVYGARAEAFGQQAADAQRLAAGTKELTDAERERADTLKQWQKDAQEWVSDFSRLVTGGIETAAERVGRTFDEMIARGRSLGAPEENLLQLEQLKQEATAVAGLVEETRRTLAAIDLERATRGFASSAKYQDLVDVRARLQAQLPTLIRHSQTYRDVEAEILKIEQELAEARGEASGGAPPHAPAPTRDMADYAREVQQAADGALQLAQNLGAADASTVSLLRGIGQVAGNLPALATAIQAKSGVGILSAALPILGALSGMLGDSPAEKERQAELRKNTEAIKELTAKAGLLGAVDASGADVGRARSQSGALLAEMRRRRLLSITETGVDPGSTLRAGSVAADLGFSWSELKRIAASLGITLNDSELSVRQFREALEDSSTKLGEFSDDLEAQRNQASAEIALLGVTDPLEQARIRMGAFAGRSSALDRVTAGLDLSTAEGRASARANIAALFALMKAGGERLGEGELGGLTGDQLLDALRELVDSLDAIEQAAGDATGSTIGVVSGYAGLTAAAGSRIEDYNRALVGYARESQVTRLAILAQLELLVQRAMMPVPVPSTSLLGAGAALGDIVLTAGAVQVHVEVTLPAGADARSAVPDAIAAAVSESLYRGVQRARVAAGDLSVTRVR